LGVYPTRRLAAAVLAAALLWFLPGVAGRIIAIAALVAIGAIVGFEYLRLPTRRGVELERFVDETLGLGDAQTIRYVLRSFWPHEVRVRLYDALPAGIDAATPMLVGLIFSWGLVLVGWVSLPLGALAGWWLTRR